MNNYEYEEKLKKEGYKIIAGCDEAGRGPLYGPVVAACCVLPDSFYLEGLTDSKKLSAKKRLEYYDYLINNVIYGVGIVEASEIDKINIYQAAKKAMYLAYLEVSKQIKVDYLLTDAMKMDIDIPVLDIIKGDQKSITISAASVIAKVTRDKIMEKVDKKYPHYEFKKHKGYPTKKHLEIIEKYGLIEGYRKTYGPVSKLIDK